MKVCGRKHGLRGVAASFKKFSTREAQVTPWTALFEHDQDDQNWMIICQMSWHGEEVHGCPGRVVGTLGARRMRAGPQRCSSEEGAQNGLMV